MINSGKKYIQTLNNTFTYRALTHSLSRSSSSSSLRFFPRRCHSTSSQYPRLPPSHPVNMSRVAQVSEKVNFAQEEHNILDYWNKINAFETSLKQSEGKPIYTFY